MIAESTSQEVSLCRSATQWLLVKYFFHARMQIICLE
jgi:hypothetical protein